jgi:hypothetical protein
MVDGNGAIWRGAVINDCMTFAVATARSAQVRAAVRVNKSDYIPGKTPMAHRGPVLADNTRYSHMAVRI